MQMMLRPEQQQLIWMWLMTCLPRSALIDQAPRHLSPFLQMQWVCCYAHNSSACPNGQCSTCHIHRRVICIEIIIRGKIPSNAWVCFIGDAISAYMIIRAFSWQLRLSPVMFEEFAAALFANHPSPFLDEVQLNICLLKGRSQQCAQTLRCCQPTVASVMKASDGVHVTHTFSCCIMLPPDEQGAGRL